MSQNEISKWNHEHRHSDIGTLLGWASERFANQLTFASSLGLEDQVIAQVISDLGLPIDVITLDTGRLHEQTLEVLDRTRKELGLSVRTLSPDPDHLEPYLHASGPFAFRESVAARRECCFIRKVLPLRRALHGAKAWVVGLRQSQSEARGGIEPISWDDSLGLVKISPLWDWESRMVRAFLDDRGTPINRLHDQGYPSIGCEPCTRAIQPGESERAGRWWWEQTSVSECGLHWHNGRPAANPLVV